MKVKCVLFLTALQVYASNPEAADLKTKGILFKERMAELVKAELERIPHYRTAALQHSKIKISNAQRDPKFEALVRDMAIIGLSEKMCEALQQYFPQSTLIADELARIGYAKYCFDTAYTQFKAQEADQKRVIIIQREARKRLAEIVNASRELNQELSLQRLYAREHRNGNSMLSCCTNVEVDE